MIIINYLLRILLITSINKHDNQIRAVRCGFGFLKSLYTEGVLRRNVCENQTRVLDLRSMCVCVCLGNIKKNGWKLNSWTLANESSKHHCRKMRIYLFYMYDSGETEVLKCFTSKYLLVFSHELETESSQMSIVLPVIWLHRRSLPDILVFWSEGFAWTIFAWGSQMFTFIMCFGLQHQWQTSDNLRY